MNEDQQRRTAIRWFLVIASILGIVISILCLVLYFQTGVWQILVIAICMLAVLALIPVTQVLLRRNQLDAAAYLILAGIIVIFGSIEFFWAGGGLFVAITVMLILPMVGNSMLPRKPAGWLILTVLFVAYVVIINWLAPDFRYDSTQSLILSFITPVAAGAAVLAVIGYTIRSLQMGTIRIRLLIAFTSLIFLPAVAISIAAGIGGVLFAQQRVLAQLESVVTLKEAEINTWVENLQIDLLLPLAGEDTMRQARVLLLGSSSPTSVREAHDTLQDRFRQVIAQTGRLDELHLLDLEGKVVLSTDATQEAKFQRSQPYFQRGLEGSYVQPPLYATRLTSGQLPIYASRPVVDDQEQVIGVLVGLANQDVLNAIMRERTGLGDTGETYLVGTSLVLLTENRFGQKEIYVPTDGARRAIAEAPPSSEPYANYEGEMVIGTYRWLPALQVGLLAEQSQSEALGPAVGIVGVSLGVALLATLLGVLAALVITRGIATPLAALAETATRIAEGDLDRTAPVTRADETGTLARAFNNMTQQLRELVSGLEQRVADRTRDLEQRSAYLEAAAEVGRAATSILETDALIQQVVELIRSSFGLYYVGLFLVDELGEWAVLQAGTGVAGQAMLARHHRIRVGEGMIGWCIAHEQARIALYAEQDAIRLLATELPNTRSEAALPLRSRGQVLGALTVQSEQANAFDQDTLIVLETMADQVAVALDNARLLAESQEALDLSRRAYGELSRQAWVRRLRERAGLGYRSREQGITPAPQEWSPEVEQAWRTGQIIQRQAQATWPLAIPIQVRDQVIGVLSTHKSGPWTAEEIALVQAVIDQLGAALESSRLFEETQRRAQDEQQLRAITAQVRDAPSLDAILQTAAQEIARALGVERAFVQLGTPPPLEPGRET